jgi:hypothetical protein
VSISQVTIYRKCQNCDGYFPEDEMSFLGSQTYVCVECTADYGDEDIVFALYAEDNRCWAHYEMHCQVCYPDERYQYAKLADGTIIPYRQYLRLQH